MAAKTRREYAEEADRKLDDLATDLNPTSSGSQTEGDYTDAVNTALRQCGFADVTEATEDAEVDAISAGVEYHALTRLLYKFLAKPTTQQGAGASGLHLMVQTESQVRSLRLVIQTARENYRDALAIIGKSLEAVQDPVAGAVIIDHEDDRMRPLVLGDFALPWMKEGYYED